MILFTFLALGLVFTFHSVRAESAAGIVWKFPDTDKYPLPTKGNLQIHDPNIIVYNNTYYAFKGGIGVLYFKAANLTGPWEYLGTVLKGPSVIVDKGNRTRPWSPTAIERNGTFYCYYAVTTGGTRDSAIGVATTTNIEDGPWTDHGALIATGLSGINYDLYPYTISNAIDPSVLKDPTDGKVWFTWGSYWTDIWQVALTDNLLAVENATSPDAKNVAYQTLKKKTDNVFLEEYPVKKDPQGIRPVEGSFMSYRSPYYYLWFSHGKCCNFAKNRALPAAGDEYSIRMGRSTSIRGPFVDKNGKNLTEGGGTIVYGSNHGDVYAPGGLGVLTAIGTDQDVLYYHYLNKSIGLEHDDAQLGWNYLEYEDGWPSVKYDNSSSASGESGDSSRGTSGSSSGSSGNSDDSSSGSTKDSGGRIGLVPLPSYAILLILWTYFYS